jgi:hypothetical protein
MKVGSSVCVWIECQQGAASEPIQWQKEQMAKECITMKVPKIKMEEDCWVINGQIITPESVGDISDMIGKNESVLRAHVPGHKGDR